MSLKYQRQSLGSLPIRLLLKKKIENRNKYSLELLSLQADL